MHGPFFVVQPAASRRNPMHVTAKSGNLPMVKFLLEGWSSLATTEAHQEGSLLACSSGFFTLKIRVLTICDETIHPDPSSFFSWANVCTATCFRMTWVYFRFTSLSFGLKLQGKKGAGVPKGASLMDCHEHCFILLLPNNARGLYIGDERHTF